MPKNQIATTESEAFELAEEMRDLALGDAGAGSENVTANDVAMPYIGILQKMSPEVDETQDAHFLPNAKVGMLFQNLNKILWDRDEGVQVVPCAFDRKIIEWIPRDAGGGLVAIHPLNTPLMREATPNDKKIPTLPNGHNLIDTSTHFVLYENPIGGWDGAIISMKSTAQKKSRLWNALIAQQLIPGQQQLAPRWMFKWRLTTVLEGEGTKTWYNWEIGKEGVVDIDIYKRARRLNEQFKAGLVSADPMAAKPLDGDEIPF